MINQLMDEGRYWLPVDIATVGRVGVSDETRTVYHKHDVSNGVSAFCRNEIVG